MVRIASTIGLILNDRGHSVCHPLSMRIRSWGFLARSDERQLSVSDENSTQKVQLYEEFRGEPKVRFSARRGRQWVTNYCLIPQTAYMRPRSILSLRRKCPGLPFWRLCPQILQWLGAEKCCFINCVETKFDAFLEVFVHTN